MPMGQNCNRSSGPYLYTLRLPFGACPSCQSSYPPYYSDLQIVFQPGLRVRVCDGLTPSEPTLARLALTPAGLDNLSHTLLGTQPEPVYWGGSREPVHSFDKYLPSTSWVPGPVLGPRGSAGSKPGKGASLGGRADSDSDKQGSALSLRRC